MSDDTTHFGYQTVDKDQKASMVADVFHSVANQYDLMNDLMSMGVHRLWKRYAIALSGVRPGQTVLDLAGGTGDLCALMADKVGPNGKIILSDINRSMMQVGRERMVDKGLVGNIEYVQANAESLPFPKSEFDLVTMAFGLRNVTDKAKALRSIQSVIKPGGRLLVLEFSKPLSDTLNKLYDSYSFNILPKLGEMIAKDADSYQYLAESIRMHPDQDTLKEMILEAGFDHCDVHNLSGGIVALHRGFNY
jgi:demethylmenaquinone methyltransferase/2-methoxy-6-polyprenyl-1,4-benzoquinol methylase